jgi:hypothetical protein
MGPGADNRRRTDNSKRNNRECFVNGGGIKNEKLRDPGSRSVLKADKRKRSIVFDYSKKNKTKGGGSYVKSLSWRIKERSSRCADAASPESLLRIGAALRPEMQQIREKTTRRVEFRPAISQFRAIRHGSSCYNFVLFGGWPSKGRMS